MSRFNRRRRIASLVPVVAVATLLPLVSGTAAIARPAHTAASKATPALGAFHGKQRVIAVLRDQSLPARGTSRTAALRSQQAPVESRLRSSGASAVSGVGAINAVVATVTQAQATTLAADPNVKEVIPDSTFRGPTVSQPTAVARPATTPGPQVSTAAAKYCGTASKPELDPEALSAIHATPTELGGSDGAGVHVAYMAEGIDTKNPDFQRNAAYASPGSAAGTKVITDYQDFTGDGTAAPTSGGEAFLDASSIAAQGNTVYDLSKHVDASAGLPAGCDVKVVGAAPGADVTGLKVFGQNNLSTTSGFLQAIDYAVSHGVKVLNESFGGNPLPDTTVDVIRQADDAAVAAGVTVVASTGDSGVTNTIGSPATDPDVIGVGATTTFRSYLQDNDGGINAKVSNGKWINNNISALSSAGFGAAGKTVDLVAPGDSNWALCTPNVKQYSDCTDLDGNPTPIDESGGTSESAPLTAAAAADVIQAYTTTHGGTAPTPALVKQILLSTAQDIAAPANEQGAGLLDVAAAIKQAKSMPGTSASSTSGTLVSPGQINVQEQSGATTTSNVSVTNTGKSTEHVKLATRQVGSKLSSHTGSFCLQPGKPTADCPANTGTLLSAGGFVEVEQNEHFTVPSNQPALGSHLVLTADYPDVDQTSVVHVALFAPGGTYAGFSSPQGFADYADVEVNNPTPGQWTAVFYTAKNDAADDLVGTSGTIQWNATDYGYGAGSAITPSTLSVPAGGTATAHLNLPAKPAAGDYSESVLVSSPTGQTTIPVTRRTIVPLTSKGGSFSGVLTGGNGRAGGPAQSDTYAFDVPSGKATLHAAISLQDDPNDAIIAVLVDPQGQAVSYSSNLTTDNFGNPASTTGLDLYLNAPQAGRWQLALQVLNPVSGAELTEPFSGTIAFAKPSLSSTLPDSQKTNLTRGKAHSFGITIANNGAAPQAFFADPRLTTSSTIRLEDIFGSDQGLPLPSPADESGVASYVIPTHSSTIGASITGTVPVTFDMNYGPGDPDISPDVSAPGVVESQGAKSASLKYSVSPEVAPGQWLVFPDEIGPYGTGPAPKGTANLTVTATTKTFDPTVTTSTGDFWSAANGLSSTFDPQYVPTGDATTIHVKITPTAKAGTVVHGVVYVDDYTLADSFLLNDNGDELQAVPFTYTVK